MVDALEAGKKVGSSPYRYMYLNTDGHLEVEYDTEGDWFELATEVVGKLLHLIEFRWLSLFIELDLRPLLKAKTEDKRVEE
jgi:hypothetical protein